MGLLHTFWLLLVFASAAQADCRLALVLALDVSRSINTDDYAIQQQGLIAALADPAIKAAFLSGDAPVAIAVFEWSGQDQQVMVSDWQLIRGPDDLTALSETIAAHQRLPVLLPTALGQALAYAHDLLANAPETCAVRVVDVSGDGQNNDGVSPRSVYADLDFTGITVNGLAIGQHESGLVDYFRAQLIHGAGAFVEIAPTQVDFPTAIRRKLIRELTQQISDVQVGAGPQG